MASQKAYTKCSCSHMGAALNPLSLDVHRAACRLPNFRIRRSATERPPASPSGREAGPVFSFYRDRSRSGIKPCNHKNQIWDKSRNKWYLSHSGCGIKSGIHTTFLARNCGLIVSCACTLRASAGARRGQDAGSAVLCSKAVHTVLPGPRAVSCLVFFAQSARSCHFTLGGVGWQRSQRINLTQAVSR